MEQKQAIEILATYIPIYSKAFEELFKLYGNDNGNKQRAYEVFQRKWEKVDLEALKTVIKIIVISKTASDFPSKKVRGCFSFLLINCRIYNYNPHIRIS